MIDREQILFVEQVQKSAHYPNMHQVECIVKRGEMAIKIQYPYNTAARANQMRQYLLKKTDKMVQPDARADVYLADQNIRTR